MKVTLNTASIDDYCRFLKIKSLPAYRFCGHEATFHDEYASRVEPSERRVHRKFANWEPSEFLFDYQKAIVNLAIRKRKFATFLRCGLGKTLIMLDFANAAREALPAGKRVLIVSPLMVVGQTIAENERFYSRTGHKLEQVRAADLGEWLQGEGGVGITNYDALTDDITQGNLGALILDESSMLKSMYGKWGQKCIELGRGLDWKLCLTGTPAPNDRIEYANHAVFLDHYPTVNAFLARFFVNRGQTDNRWELKPHALEPFYRALSHWAIFLNSPATYGWKDNCDAIPPIRVHVEHVELTKEQEALIRRITGKLVVTELGGITARSKLAQLAKGFYGDEPVATNKYQFIRDLVGREPNRGTIAWARYNDEQDTLAETLPGCANIDGSTPLDKRLQLIGDFKNGLRQQLVSKPKILGFGLNLQCATRQVFSTLQDSYEEYVQALARSNRIGSTEPLDAHIPVTELERPMIETVLRKCRMVEDDTREQERIFKQFGVTQ